MASIADQIAYRSHDVEDSITAGILAPEDYHAARLPLWDEVWAELGRIGDAHVRLPQVTRRLINRMVGDVLGETARRLEAHAACAVVDDVYGAQAVLVDFSAALRAAQRRAGGVPLERFYKDYRVLRGMVKGQMVISRIFQHFADRARGTGACSRRGCRATMRRP